MKSLYAEQSILLPEDVRLNLKYGITDLELNELMKRYNKLKPVVKLNNGDKYVIDDLSFCELYNESYQWKALSLENYVMSNFKKIDKGKLQELRDFICLHSFCFPGFFKPSVHEVLAQIPQDLMNEADFFEIVERPRTVQDMNMYKYVTSKSYHLSRVMTYKLK